MPKNPHPPRGGAKSKKAPVTNDGDDTSFIVFSNKKSDPGISGTNARAPAATKTATSQPEAEDAPKKPDTRTLIGGASWTGKLPVNILAEHCQKQKWEKPEYTMSRVGQGYTSMVILKAKNSKTQELTTLPPMGLPPSHRDIAVEPTALEARHFAAAYTLYRVCSMRNIHMMMPPKYRDLWKTEFHDLKKDAVAEGQAWMYEADPFMARRERDEARALAEKKRLDRSMAKLEEPKTINLSGGMAGGASNGSRTVSKGWSRAPKIEMGKRTRKDIERLIRNGSSWNPHGVLIPQAQFATIIREFTGLGFRQSHVEEALAICKDREEALEWLLIHIPEDDLPQWALPESYTAGVSLASGNLQREGKIQRLAAAGYVADLCAEALEASGDDEAAAALLLQDSLLYGTMSPDAAMSHTKKPSLQEPSADSELDVWQEEQHVLASIYGDRHKIGSPSDASYLVRLRVPNQKGIILQVRKPPTGYPNNLPIISISAELPAYIRLSIVKRALEHARSELLGEQMIFSLVDWLENEIPNIIADPGKLSDIAAAAAAQDDASGSHRRSRQTQRYQPRPKLVRWQPSAIGQKVLETWKQRQNSPAQQRMMQVRQSLPAWNLRVSIVQTVRNNQVTIISGETGSGKSTQSVQFVLDDMIQRQLGEAANIICTQPRRISALGLADRVSDERCTPVGDEIGYAIRGESKQKVGTTKITFVTTGVLLRRMQTAGGREEDLLNAVADISHIVVDEVHERSLDTDFLLILLKTILAVRKDLRVILMSATLDADVFKAYFGDTATVGLVDIPGRTYPVEDLYVDDIVRFTGFNGSNGEEEDEAERPSRSLGDTLRAVGMRINYDLIVQTVRYIDSVLGSETGGILIFLPGTMEIDRTIRALTAVPNLHALPLHASLQSAEQRRVFPSAPAGKRKVIAATNVAETSITIEDIVAVIDTGRVKETSFDPQNNMVKLEEVWASRAACKQRRGRAGRVRPGKCYKLYTRNAETKMMERPEPEIRRVPLEQLCLSVKAMGVANVPKFLSSALTPPESLAVEGAVELLGRMGALDGSELTALGYHLAMIPADLRCGKLLVYGATFGCLEACLTIASILTVRSPFVSPQTKRDESKAARAAFGRSQGDLVCDLRAYERWAEMRYGGHPSYALRQWCEQNFLSHQTLNDILSNRSQYLSSLKETGFIPYDYHSASPSALSRNRNNDNDAVLRALIAGSFNPQIARIDFPDKKYAASMSGAVELDPEARTIKYFNQDNGRVFVHPSSTLFDAQTFAGNSVYMSYFTKMATSKVFIRDLTPFNAYSLLLLSGPITLDTLGRGLFVDGWLRLRGWARIGVLVSRLRMMLDEVLAKKIDDPSVDLEKNEVVDVVRRLIELDGLDR
ncbi:putative ATP-dependent RNA helicase ucp12 [Elasticomyces elasticus]|nr:putative ATP-dependent RNA helicase ucp12 [Elasticomyces elasticus]